MLSDTAFDVIMQDVISLYKDCNGMTGSQPKDFEMSDFTITKDQAIEILKLTELVRIGDYLELIHDRLNSIEDYLPNAK